MDLNKIIISGRLGRDPEVKQTNDGQDWCTFSVAVNRYAKKGSDAEADWFNCTAFGKTAAFIAQYFHKGDGITLEGHMQSQKKDDKMYWNMIVDRPYFEHGKKNDKTETETDDSLPEGFSQIRDEDIPF